MSKKNKENKREVIDVNINQDIITYLAYNNKLYNYVDNELNNFVRDECTKAEQDNNVCCLRSSDIVVMQILIVILYQNIHSKNIMNKISNDTDILKKDIIKI